MASGDLWSRLESARNYLLDRGDYSEHGTDTVSATIIDEARQRIRELEKQYADGLAAWKANNAHHAAEIERLRARLDELGDF